MAEVIGVDTQHHLVQTQESDLPFDYLILATGARYNYFGHDEWVTFAPGLHSVDDADLIRGKF
jgi:NADH dehydrogenase